MFLTDLFSNKKGHEKKPTLRSMDFTNRFVQS